MASFVGSFLGGFAARATERRDRDEDRRQQLIRDSMVDLREVIRTREARIEEARRRREQAGVLAGVNGHGLPAATVEGLLSAGFTPEQIASGQIRAAGGINGAAAAEQTPQAIGVTAPSPGGSLAGGGNASAAAPPSPSPAGPMPSAPGLGAPGQSPMPPDPRGQAMPPQAPQTASDQISIPSEGRSTLRRVSDAILGRDPRVGVAEEARSIIARNRGMTPEQLQEVMNGPPPVAPIAPGSVTFNPFTPEQLARMGMQFQDQAGLRRFIETRGQDTSGVVTFGDYAATQARMAAIRAAGRRHEDRPYQPNASDFNAAVRAMTLIPGALGGRAGLSARTDNAGNVTGLEITGIATNTPEYARAREKAARAIEAVGRLLAGEFRGNHGGAAVAALREATSLPSASADQENASGGAAPGRPDRGRGNTPARVERPAQQDNSPPREIRNSQGDTLTFERMRNGIPLYRNQRTQALEAPAPSR